MNKNLAVTLVGALLAVLTLVTDLLPDGGWKSGLLALKNAMENGPLHDLLLYGAGVITAAGFGRLFKTQPTATGLPPDASVVAADIAAKQAAGKQ